DSRELGVQALRGACRAGGLPAFHAPADQHGLARGDVADVAERRQFVRVGRVLAFNGRAPCGCSLALVSAALKLARVVSRLSVIRMKASCPKPPAFCAAS